MDVRDFYARYLRRCNDHRFGELGEFVAADVRVNGRLVGLEGYAAGLCAVTEAFGDYTWTIDHLLVQDDWLAVHLLDTGTHTGTFHGVAATGRSISTHEFAHYRLRDGKIAEVWVTADDLSTVGQLRAGYVIRPAERTDVPELAELSRRWAAEGITIGQGPDDEAWFEDALGPYLLVAESGGTIVGFCQGAEESTDERHTAIMPVGTPYLDVCNIYVVPQRRSGGIGGALLDALLGSAAERGIERSMVYSAAAELDRVLSFYRGHGFTGWYVQLYR